MTTIKVYSPYDEHLIEEIPMADKSQCVAAMDAAERVFNDRSQWLKPYERIAILEKTAAIMESRKSLLAHTAAEEGGKPLQDSEVEVARAIQGVKVAIEHIPQMTGREIAMNVTESSKNRRAYTFREPVGMVAAISAFNHPLNLIIHQVIPAVAVGCPVIVKPATSTPLSCLNMLKILHEAGLPQAWAQALVMKNTVAERLITDPRTRFLSFIGSAKVGWMLRSKLPAGASAALEHGGAAPVIVEPDADLDDALPLLVKGGFYHAGQVCVSVQRVFVHESICQDFVERMVERVEKLKVGDPLDPTTEVGPLISPKEVDRVDDWVKQAKSKGADILCGGKKLSDTCYQPTVILNPPQDVNVSQFEIFGPVVCVYSYSSREQAIKHANQLPLAFQSAVFTKDLDVAMDMVNRLEANVVLVNDHTAFRVDWMPFGGRKESGLAMGGIPYSMEDMSFEKMMVIRSPVL